MIPSIVARQLQDCVSDYLLTTFRGTTPGFDTLMERFLDRPENVGRGPYIFLGLPFRPGEQGANYFPEIPLQFQPHRHQERAFDRLSPPYFQSTIVATGTGSGKTECFLLPLLEHCRQQAGNRGIKAILIYPMNALATDQAKRIAELIDRTPSLKGQVTAGLYVGGQEQQPTTMMSATQVITDKSILRHTPPDILLTNYKMLDYLLIQPEAQGLWQYNQPETLRYLVVDEFHTFDGAQGTDLACLLRRLKHRLQTPKDHLACVGTSATLGNSDSKQEMLTYASQIFQESFDELAVIEEARLSAGEFLADALLNVLPVPPPPLTAPNPIQSAAGTGVKAYLHQQVQLWLGDYSPTDLTPADAPLSEAYCIELGEKLATLPIVQILLKTVGEKTYSYPELLRDVIQKRLALPSNDPLYQQQLLDSLLSLIATARRRIELTDGTAIVVPWVTLRVQFWLRELRRMVGSIDPQPELLFSSDLTPDRLRKALPIVHCRDCGATGWAGLRPQQGQSRLAPNDLQSFYRAFFGRSPLVTYIFPTTAARTTIAKHDRVAQFCPDCLRINLPDAAKCASCDGDRLISVFIPDSNKDESHQGQKHTISHNDCPFCHSSSGLSILGAQAASLTSAMIGVLYTTPFNTDKKLLTFSDSVQDAAHRAGFYAARTYRTTLRTAIAHTVRNLATEELTLATLIDRFPDYWQSKFTTTADYIATFLPADLVWLRDWDNYIKGDKLDLDRTSTLPNLLGERLTWEIVQQFGHRSAVGPSLERSGSCSVSFPTQTIAVAVAKLHLTLTNEIEPLRSVRLDRVEQFILGILHHLRQRGGILQPATENYIISGGNTFLWKKYTYMPAIGPRIPAPIFYVNATAKADRFERAIDPGTKFSWCEDWTERIFRDTTLILKDTAIEIIHTTLTVLTAVGLLQEKHLTEGGKAWGIPLAELQLHGEGQVIVCDRCRHQLTASPLELDRLQQMTCMTKGCEGHYQTDPNNGLAYYRQLYHSGEVQRIIAADHTGLLDRDSRELLEQRFIKGERRCDPNLLSATSTLEMGINIGDLSTVFLCSVPPSTANFQQRIGRAGRRDGNALVSTIANVKPHDLYFYAEPEEMIAGNVTPAGCYLDASAILERQLTAFCLDEWVRTGIQLVEFPKFLRDALSSIEKFNPQRFPYNWLQYIQTHQAQLIADFEGLFDDSPEERLRQRLTTDTRTHLRQFMEQGEHQEGGLGWRILNRLQNIQNERKRLVSQVKKIGKKIKEAKELPEVLQAQERDRLQELEIEKSSLNALIKEIDRKQILNFLTDEGLLPNYAFPEAGVTLKSIIWRKPNTTEDGNGKRYETSTLTYERPGSLAIRELVPNSTFYAEGRQVKIDQIDLQLSEIERWRMCRNCSCSRPPNRPEFQAQSCPRCGDGMWSDAGQLRTMIRLRQVMATTSDRDSRFGDDSEERNASFFQRSLLVDFEPEYREQTYLVTDPEFPFGFEYIARSSFREVNLGERSQIGIGVTIGGENFNTKGFKICTGCGKVINRNESKEHGIACRYRSQPDRAKIENVLYLYREFESEAIRFLLPDETFWTTKGKSSFIASLQLGLKLKFRGQIDHLKVTIASEPQPNSSQRKSFLYLYDSVPGGTGYLKQLINNPQELQSVFQQALEHIRVCPCEDGCYRCLFAYRNSFDRDETSRKTAIQELANILKHWSQLAENSTGLSAIRVNSNFESELERRFIEAIRRYRGIAKDREPPILKSDIINGKAGYYLKLGEEAWTIEMQVSLDSSEGVNYPSRTDFVFRPASSRQHLKPIAIFTDGWEYHRDRLDQDFQQRLAIIRSDRYWCWSITWDDVEAQINPDKITNCLDGLNHHLNPSFNSQPLEFYRKYQCDDLRTLESGTSFDWLMFYLAHPRSTEWEKWALMRTAAQVNPQLNLGTWQQEVSNFLGSQAIELWAENSNYFRNSIEISLGLKLWLGVDIKRHPQIDRSASLVAIVFEDTGINIEEDKVRPGWVESLRLANLYQFLPHFYLLSSSMVNAGTIPPLANEFGSAASSLETSAWAEVKSLMVDEELIPAIDRMEAENWLLPELGYELMGERQIVMAMAELAWVNAQIAIVLTPEDRAAFVRSGWLAYAVPDLNPEVLTKIQQKL